jgi:AmiR/NasT family two-component response regulator
VMAAHICAALSRAEAIFGYRNQVEQLRRAMDSRAVIEQAKGMVMAQRRCSAVDAFTELRTMSMNQNIKLAELAASIVSGASGHPVRFDDDGQ